MNLFRPAEETFDKEKDGGTNGRDDGTSLEWLTGVCGC